MECVVIEGTPNYAQFADRFQISDSPNTKSGCTCVCDLFHYDHDDDRFHVAQFICCLFHVVHML